MEGGCIEKNAGAALRPPPSLSSSPALYPHRSVAAPRATSTITRRALRAAPRIASASSRMRSSWAAWSDRAAAVFEPTSIVWATTRADRSREASVSAMSVRPAAMSSGAERAFAGEER